MIDESAPTGRAASLVLRIALIAALGLSAVACSIGALPARPAEDGSDGVVATADVTPSADATIARGTGGFDVRTGSGGAGGTTTGPIDAPTSSGDATGTGGFLFGGITGAGGAGTGGAIGSGGKPGTGGITFSGTGGAGGVGGTGGRVSTGGTILIGTGGAGAGGTIDTGGNATRGGSGGTSATGGAAGTGGTVARGGSTGTGGTAGSGGTPASGSATGTGGSVVCGGTAPQTYGQGCGFCGGKVACDGTCTRSNTSCAPIGGSVQFRNELVMSADIPPADHVLDAYAGDPWNAFINTNCCTGGVWTVTAIATGGYLITNHAFTDAAGFHLALESTGSDGNYGLRLESVPASSTAPKPEQTWTFTALAGGKFRMTNAALGLGWSLSAPPDIASWNFALMDVTADIPAQRWVVTANP